MPGGRAMAPQLTIPIADETSVSVPRPITVVTRRRLRPDHIEAFLALIPVQIPRQRPGLLGTTRVFQSRTDPQSMLGIREWPSREAWTQRPTTGQAARDALTEGAAEYRFYRWLRRFAIADRPIAHATGAYFRCPTATRDAVAAYLLDAGPAVHRQPGCVHRTLYEDLDEPNLLLVVNGWASLEAAEAAQNTLWPQLDVALQTLGIPIEVFRGRTRLELPPERQA
jgi:quinol monooxygenase YgiN